MARDRIDLLQGTLDLLILKTLDVLGPMHGFGIASRIRQVSDEVFQPNQGSLYPALHRLERKRLVRATWGESDNNRRAKFYELTATGKKTLAAETRQWRRITGGVERVLQMG